MRGRLSQLTYLHQSVAPELYDTDDDANRFLPRGVLPHKIGGAPQIFRYTLPILTVPDDGGHTTGLGDLNVIDLFLFQAGKLELGLGPQCTFPTVVPFSIDQVRRKVDKSIDESFMKRGTE